MYNETIFKSFANQDQFLSVILIDNPGMTLKTLFNIYVRYDVDLKKEYLIYSEKFLKEARKKNA